MKTFTSAFYKWIVALSLLGIFVLLLSQYKGCGGKGERDTLYYKETFYFDTVTHVYHDTVIYRSEFIREVPTVITDSGRDAIAFHSVYFQRDTIRTDTFDLFMGDSIIENRIFWRHAEVKWKPPVMTVREITLSEPKRNHWYIGGGLLVDSLARFKAGGMMTDKKSNAFSFGFTPFNKTKVYELTYYRKLR